MIGSIIGGIASLAGGLLGSNSADKAAEQQAQAVAEAQRISKEQADQARLDAMQLYNPALNDYNEAMGMSVDELTSGRTRIADILNRNTALSNQALTSYGQSAVDALLGPRPGSNQGMYPGGGRRNMTGTVVDDGMYHGPIDGTEQVYGPGGQSPTQPVRPDPTLPDDTISLVDPDLPPTDFNNGGPDDSYLLPAGVTREEFERFYNNTKNMTTNSKTGATYTPEQQYWIAGQQAQNQAQRNWLRSQGRNTGRETADVGNGQFGFNETAFANMPRQTYGAPPSANAQQQNTAQRDMTSITAPITFRR